MLLEPKAGIIYGLVASRRLGFSLGINVLPAGQKYCSFDCAYCQYGWTKRAPAGDDPFPAVGAVLAAVEEALEAPAVFPAYLTFSGNGEPTTHPEFLAIVEGVRTLRYATDCCPRPGWPCCRTARACQPRACAGRWRSSTCES